MGRPAVKRQEIPTETDPVCGMAVAQTSRYRFSHKGAEYRFCSEGCRSRFAADPASYLSGDDDQEGDGQCHDLPRRGVLM